MTRLFCPQCDGFVDYVVETREETYPVKGEDITIPARVSICKQCGESIFNEDLDDQNLQEAYDVFRREHGILSPSRISQLREKYGLSQRALGRLLRFGEITINRYENGSLPSEAHNELLVLIEEPNNVKMLLDTTGHDLRPDEEKALRKRIAELTHDSPRKKLISASHQILSDYQPSIFSGFRAFQGEKIRTMVVMCAKRAQPLSKIKLMKLLFYMDFLHFKENGVSISGMRYAHLPYGPAVNDWKTLLNWLELEGDIYTEETMEYGGNFEASIIDSDRDVAPSDFDEEELEVVETVLSRFGVSTAKELVNLSHREDAYISTEHSELIPYEHALSLNVDLK